jgi:cytochrome c oxidase subunit 2
MWLFQLLNSALAQADSSTFMPPAATELASQVDSIYSFLLWASLISFVLLIGGMIFFVIKYKRRTPNDKTAYITHNHTLEFLWSFIPFCIFIFAFAWGWIVFHQYRSMPENGLEIHVVAKKWDWRFIYKNGREVTAGVDDQGNKTPATMVVPLGRPVKLIMASEKVNPASNEDPRDRPVLHSFYVPAFRQKQDVVPGRYTTLWFQATELGTFNVFCAEYCGDGHYSMRAAVKVVKPAEYEEWLSGEAAGGAGGKPLSLAEQGKNIYATHMCIGCHSLNGSAGSGPTWKGIWGHEVATDKGTVKIDENYIRESILQPNAKIVNGFQGGVMPSFAGQLKDDEINALIEFIKTVK